MKERIQMTKINLERFKEASTADSLGVACGFATEEQFDAALVSAATTLLLVDSKERTTDLLSEDEHVAFAMLIIPNVLDSYPSPLFDTAAESILHYFTSPAKAISDIMNSAVQHDELLNRIMRDELKKVR